MYEARSDYVRGETVDEPADSMPVILVGRGGSGTRLLSQLALSVGVFLGNEMNVSSDSVEWVEDIYNLAIEATTAGMESGSDRDRFWRKRLRLRAATILAKGGRSPRDSWGWKLPETILILPQILRAFPCARVVHLVRHPVTSSLRRTHMTSRLTNPIGRVVLPVAYRACGLDPANLELDDSWIHNAVTWTYQVGQALEVLSGMVRSDRILQLRFEELCVSPAEARNQLSVFLGKGLITTACGLEIDPCRLGEVRTDDLRAERVWAICGEVAMKIGYSLDP